MLMGSGGNKRFSIVAGECQLPSLFFAIGYLLNIPGTTPPSGGTLTPTNAKINSATIRGVFTTFDVQTLFEVVLEGTLAQNFFTGITIDGATYSTASLASYQTTGGLTYWRWAISSPQLDVGQTYLVTWT